MNKELLQQKAAEYGNLHSYPNTAKLGFLAGTNDVINNPELYDLVKKDKYDECIPFNNYLREEYLKLQKENKELQEKITQLETVINKLSHKIILYESNY